jgi:hypothetical protein
MESTRALQIVDVLHLQFDFINGYHFVFKFQNDTILIHGFYTKNEVILRLINLVILNNIRLRKVPFAIGIFKEVQLNFSFLFGLKPPIWSIPRLWNQPFQGRKQQGFVFIDEDKVTVRTRV